MFRTAVGRLRSRHTDQRRSGARLVPVPVLFLTPGERQLLNSRAGIPCVWRAFIRPGDDMGLRIVVGLLLMWSEITYKKAGVW